MLEEALRESEFQLILNANPGSRVRVEAGGRTKGGYMGLRGTSELPFQIDAQAPAKTGIKRAKLKCSQKNQPTVLVFFTRFWIFVTCTLCSWRKLHAV